MNKPWFTLSIPPDKCRKMTRKEYYDQKRYLRITARLIAKEMEGKQKEIEEHFSDLICYGVSPVRAFFPIDKPD